MIKRFQNYIENEPWDEKLLRLEPMFNRVCWAVIIFAAGYFLPICIAILTR